MAECGEDIVAPSASKAPVWRYFEYVMDLTTGRAAVGKRATCKLCRVRVAHSGGTTNLKNHLHFHHRPEYRNLYGDDLGSCVEVQSQLKMDYFISQVVLWSCPRVRRERKN